MKEYQAIDPYRKKPKQMRSEETIEVIFEAAARILQTKGLDKFNTNAIAGLAGISIGTLYQYFPNKNAILVALARRELGKVSGVIIKNITAEYASNENELARVVVRSLLKAFGGRQRARKVLIEALVANGLSQELSRPIDDVMQAIFAQKTQLQTQHFKTMTPVGLYVMTRAVIGTIRSVVMEQSDYLGTEEFEEELVRLFLYCMRGYR